MSKAFTRENDSDDDEDFEGAPKLPAGLKNYLTPGGFRQLQEEYKQLWDVERPALVQTVAWAASNGDRSENGDYIYGKKRLREIDRRLRFLAKRLENAQVVDPEQRGECEQVFFGATVTVLHGNGEEKTYCIVGIDEANVSRGHISWVSPLARTLLKAREGDVLNLALPVGVEEIEVLEVQYLAIDVCGDVACDT